MMEKIFIISILLFFVIACSDKRENSTTSQVVNCDNITSRNADRCLRLNHIQVLGTHNSYKLLPHPELVETLNQELDGWSKDISYEHKPLDVQLEELGIRQFELDIFADPEGGRYAIPSGAVLVEDSDFIKQEVMMQPGFKIIHIPDIDYRTTCLTFKSCLNQIRNWSLENPNHLPIMIMVEAKDGEIRDWASMTFTKPIPFNTELMHDIDIEIKEVFEDDHIITPDKVRGHYNTLDEAVQASGWPTLSESRGKVLFALDNTSEHKTMYLNGNPNLEGRAMFVSSGPGEPTAGFIKMNDALRQAELIKDYISEGYLIRTRTDLPTYEARSGNTKRMEVAFQSGAQYLSTDYPEVSPFGSGYIVEFPNTNGIARCNPVSSPQGCQNNFLKE